MKEDIRKIKEAIENNKLVIFVGAGVSIGAGLPSWGALVEEYKKRLDLSEADKYLPESYLKIPQYYYNKRGFKEYYDVLYRVFDKNCVPNKIHTLIYKLSPQHIITTNYDNLLEQERDRLGLLYDVVSEDRDLPYTPNGRLIIKMHGDLEKKNVVLKEDDYLAYSRNFSMIETYIKALFTNHTVMFLGYSVDDYNLKLIIDKVKNVLGEHFQRGYILNSEEELVSSHEKDYFSKLGFNIVQKDSIEEGFWDKKNYQEKDNRTKNLRGLLEYINECYDAEEETMILQHYYNVLSIFDDFNYVSTTDLVKVLGCQYCDRAKDMITLVIGKENDKVERLIKRLIEISKWKVLKKEEAEEYGQKIGVNKVELRYFKAIQEVFIKADIRVIRLRHDYYTQANDTVVLEFENIPVKFTSNIVNNLLECASEKMIKFILRNDDMYKRESSLYMQEMTNAYIDYLNKKYLRCYKKLKDIMERAYKDKKYLICYIVEYNRIQVVKLLERVNKGYYSTIGETMMKDEIEASIKEYKDNKINLDDIYEMLSKSQKSNLTEVKLFQFDNELIYQKQNRIYELRKKQKESYKKSTVSNLPINIIDTIRHEVYSLWYMINLNHFMISHYIEVSKFYLEYFEILCMSYKEGDSYISSFFGAPTLYDIGIRKVPLNILDFNIIIMNLESSELNKACEEYEITTLTTEIEVQQLKNIFKNLLEQYEDKEAKVRVRPYLKTFINLLGHIELDDEKMDSIVEEMIHLIDKNIITDDTYESITYFILKQSNVHSDKNKIEEISKKILISYLKKLSDAQCNNKQGGGEINVLERWNLIDILVNNINKEYDEDIQACFESLIENIGFGKMFSMEALLIEKLLIRLYKYLTSDQKQMVYDWIKINLEKYFNISLYTESLAWEIFEPIEEFETCFWKYIDSEVEQKSKGFICSPDNLRKYLIKAALLNQESKILNGDQLKKYKGEYEIVDLIMAPKEFDYENKFELIWLGQLGEKQLQKLIEIPNVKERIAVKLKKEIGNIAISKDMLIGIKYLL